MILQFYVWFFHTLPLQRYLTPLPNLIRLLMLIVIESSWNVFPATPTSSGQRLLQLLHSCNGSMIRALSHHVRVRPCCWSDIACDSRVRSYSFARASHRLSPDAPAWSARVEATSYMAIDRTHCSCKESAIKCAPRFSWLRICFLVNLPTVARLLSKNLKSRHSSIAQEFSACSQGRDHELASKVCAY
jgi:hypothetical protein